MGKRNVKVVNMEIEIDDMSENDNNNATRKKARTHARAHARALLAQSGVCRSE